MLLLTLRGTPTLYYGDEIAMQNVPIPPALVQDPFEKNVPGLGLGRDPARTPMQWSPAANAGFTRGAPWLPIADDYTSRNVEAQTADPKSILTLYRRLIQLRREQAALSIGTYQPIPAQGDLLAYRRSFDRGRRYLVVLNLSSEPATYQGAAVPHHGRVAVSTHLDREAERFAGQIDLRGDEGLLIELADG
jgi:alpha-glucosidase